MDLTADAKTLAALPDMLNEAMIPPTFEAVLKIGTNKATDPEQGSDSSDN